MWGVGGKLWSKTTLSHAEAGDPTRSHKTSHYLDKLMNLYPFFFKKSSCHFNTSFRIEKEKAS